MAISTMISHSGFFLIGDLESTIHNPNRFQGNQIEAGPGVTAIIGIGKAVVTHPPSPGSGGCVHMRQP